MWHMHVVWMNMCSVQKRNYKCKAKRALFYKTCKYIIIQFITVFAELVSLVCHLLNSCTHTHFASSEDDEEIEFYGI